MDGVSAAPIEVKKPTGFRFLDLPYEIRLEIYRNCLPNGFVFDASDKPTFLGSIEHYEWYNDMMDRERRAEREALEQKWAKEAKQEELERERAIEAYLRRKRKYEVPTSIIHHPSRKRVRRDTEDDNVEKKEDEAMESRSTDESSERSWDSDGSYDEYVYDSETDSDFTDEEEVPTAHQELLAAFAEMQQAMDEKRLANGEDIDAWVSDPEYDSDPPFEPPTPAYNYPHDKGAIEGRGPSWMRVLHGLLISCRQVREEALGVLYGENVFRVRQLEGEQRFLWERLPEERRQRIRHIMIELRSDHWTPFNRPGKADIVPNSALWDPMFPNLVSVRILAQQPTEPKTSFYDMPLFRDHSEDCLLGIATATRVWLVMIKPTLEYFGPRILPSTMVMVDDNGSKEVGELLERCLPTFRRVRTDQGEHTFKRHPDHYDEAWGYGRRARYRHAGSHSGSTPPPPECDCNEGFADFEAANPHWRDEVLPL
jgi:hypothetical protein